MKLWVQYSMKSGFYACLWDFPLFFFPLFAKVVDMEAKKSKFTPITQVRPDSKGRVTLSKLTKGVSSYTVSQDEEGRLLFEPMVEIPAREKWLFNNPEALLSVRRGIADAKVGKIKSLGSFADYAEEEDEES